MARMPSKLFWGAAIAVGATVWCAHPVGQPAATVPSRERPSQIYTRRGEQPPPPLDATGDSAKVQVRNFIQWAGASTVAEHEDGRRVIHGARDNKDIIDALIAEIGAAESIDHSRTLLVLGILGETQSAHAEPFLRQFVKRALPAGGHAVDGEILEQTAFATLQAKAIDGLAYAHTISADSEVLLQVREHPSRIVRAEAIRAYLLNHEASAAARETLLRYVRPDERQFIDRPQKGAGESGRVFNMRLAEYLRSHPELVPPRPTAESTSVKKTGRRGTSEAPPTF